MEWQDCGSDGLEESDTIFARGKKNHTNFPP